MSNVPDRRPQPEAPEAALESITPLRQTLFWIDDDFFGGERPPAPTMPVPRHAASGDAIEVPDFE